MYRRHGIKTDVFSLQERFWDGRHATSCKFRRQTSHFLHFLKWRETHIEKRLVSGHVRVLVINTLIRQLLVIHTLIRHCNPI